MTKETERDTTMYVFVRDAYFCAPPQMKFRRIAKRRVPKAVIKQLRETPLVVVFHD